MYDSGFYMHASGRYREDSCHEPGPTSQSHRDVQKPAQRNGPPRSLEQPARLVVEFFSFERGMKSCIQLCDRAVGRDVMLVYL